MNEDFNGDLFTIPQDTAEDTAENVVEKSAASQTNKSFSFWSQGLNLILSLIGLSGVIFGVFNLYHFNQVSQNSQVGQSSQPTQPHNPDLTATSSSSVNIGQIYVDVSGAVEQPGLYQLPSGSRVAAALKQAGGLTAGADQDYAVRQLNLAQKLQDEQKLYFPTQQETAYQAEVAEFCAAELGQTSQGLAAGEQASVEAGEQASVAAGASSSLVSINSAVASQLEDLPDIGEKRAEDIIQNRPYQNLTELVSKEVITDNILSKIKNLIKL